MDADVWEALVQDIEATVDDDQGHASGVQLSPPPSSETLHPLTSPPNPPIRDGSDSNTTGSQAQVIVDSFPHGVPGTPMPDPFQGQSDYRSREDALNTSVWAPFHSQCDWEIALWAKMRGPTSSALTELLQIPEVTDRLGVSYSSAKELDRIIDALPGRPPFECEDFTIGGERLSFYFRNVLQCIRTLFGDPEFAHELAFAPERHYSDPERTCRVYSEMHTGDWWWAVQTSLESQQPGATVVPLILSSDKTQLTLFRGKAAYPVYLTIGNIPKAIRRKPSRHAQLLIGYIPTTRFEGITNQAARRRALANLFHSCMRKLLAPVTHYSESGIAMMSGDGIWRRCHPVFAVFVGDYPEQTLVTCTYNGRCPKCTVPLDRLGEYTRFPPRSYDKAIDTFLLADEEVRTFHAACREAALKPVFHPFWESFPLSNIFISITPDILHQLLQGVAKHLMAWLRRAFGPVAIDARCRSLPPNHHVTTFAKGISGLSRVTGLEHKNMCRILLGLIIDHPLPSGQAPLRLVRTVRALLDFLYLAQLPSQTTDTLRRLEDSLASFHSNKSIFVDLGIRDHFNIPKVHSLIHYSSSITLFGTTDNYNTEQTERLHIDFAKDAYRATNHKDEYKQMTTWLERREKVQQHIAFIKRRQGADQENMQIPQPSGPPQPTTRCIKMTLHPSTKATSFDVLAVRYGAVEFQDALADFIAQTNHPDASTANLRDLAADTLIPFRSVPTYHKIKFQSNGHPEVKPEVVDAIHVRPEQMDSRGRRIPSRFDTVLIRNGNNGYQIAQVRVVFQLPNKAIPEVFPSLDTAVTAPPTHLAYVEWFSPIPARPDANQLMYRVSRLMHNGHRRASIIPVSSIISSIHLFPRFGHRIPPEWNTYSVLELCHTFYVNPFSDRDTYLRFLS
ncbi:hypothetical protein EDB85DRAFT_1875899 [Lactarius pseudohatsudake]|nr:hypothetical protein EDB85DRAFT_1875899 [Lactarius pseudohatsudake]